MKIYKELKQGTPEWLEVRLGKFTASDAQAIATNGAGLKTLVYEKAAEIMTGKVKESYTNADIERGKELEKMARSAYELETGKLVKEVGFVEVDESEGCSPDGLVGDDGLVEAKCFIDYKFVEFLFSSKVDTAHLWQMQMQLLDTDRKWVDYLVYNQNFPNPLIIVRVMRDEKMIEKIKIGLDSAKKQLKEILKTINK